MRRRDFRAGYKRGYNAGFSDGWNMSMRSGNDNREQGGCGCSQKRLEDDEYVVGAELGDDISPELDEFCDLMEE